MVDPRIDQEDNRRKTLNQILRGRIASAHHEPNRLVIWRTEHRGRGTENTYVARGSQLEPLQSWIDREMGNGNSINGVNGHGASPGRAAVVLVQSQEFNALLERLGIVPIS
jgi:hypothetical protein